MDEPKRLPRWAVSLVAVVAVAMIGGVGAAVLTAGDDDEARPREEVEPEPEGPVEGGVLRLGLERPEALDPATADRGLQSEVLAADLMFDGLTAYDLDTESATPSVAESWTHEDEFKRWKFVVRDGATFHNGRQIQASDIAFSLNRVARRGTTSTASVQLEPVQGYRQFAVDGQGDGLDGVKFDDAARTVEIILDTSLPSLPLLLSHPVYGVVPREAVEAEEPKFAEEPVGSGPFQLTRRTPDVLTLTAVDGSDSFLDGITVTLVDDSADAYRLFEDDELDVVRVPADRVSDAAASHGDDHFAPYAAELFYALNLKQPKLGDVRFRRAILAAIDREAIVEEVYGGTVLLLNSIVPKGVPGHQDDVCPDECDAGTDRAKELVAEVFPDGNVPTIQIDFDEGAPQDDIAQRIHDDLEAAGIPAELRAKPFEAEGDDDYQTLVASGNQELFRLGWIGSYPDPRAFLPPLFRSDALDNVIGLSDPSVDEVFGLAQKTGDETERIRLYREAEAKILEMVPIVPLVQFQTHMVASDRVRDLEVNVLGSFDATGLWLAEDRSPA